MLNTQYFSNYTQIITSESILKYTISITTLLPPSYFMALIIVYLMSSLSTITASPILPRCIFFSRFLSHSSITKSQCHFLCNTRHTPQNSLSTSSKRSSSSTCFHSHHFISKNANRSQNRQQHRHIHILFTRKSPSALYPQKGCQFMPSTLTPRA